jgi:tetratricopeptide (TPR) repeat protein/tRNA A-37 threonylcarbamoyl transferase component Bud32
LGTGGMGEVYKAHDTVLERDVAIKMMHRHLLEHETHDARFMSEAKIIAKLAHPNIVTIHEIGKTKRGPYIVMEYVEGESIKTSLLKNGPMEKEQAIQLVMQILHGLQYAHHLGILHRDIKSENVLVTSNDHVKILDFGIAKIISNPGLTAAGDLLGTVEYMAPEQLLGKPIDNLIDLYATAVLLYQMLTNHLPFESDTPAAILYKKLNEEPLPVSYYNQGFPPDLDNVILKALHYDKNQRWESASQFSQALDSATKRGVTSRYMHEDIVSALAEHGAKLAIAENEDPNNANNAARPGTVFIGRQKELRELIYAYNQSAHGNGRTVILMGEAGVGKSTLAAKLSDHARVNNALVLYGACLYQDGMDAYLPYIDALRTFFSNESKVLPEERRLEIKEVIRKKVPFLLEFSERFTTNFGPKDVYRDPKQNLIEGVFVLLSVLAEIQPVVLIIDDLQWADEASLRLFHYISRHVSKHRILLFGISRTDRCDLRQNGKPGIFLELVSRIRHDDNLNQLTLNRLERQLCDQLIDTTMMPNLFSDELYETVFNETRGNPLFISETLKQLQKSNTIYWKNDTWYNTDNEITITVPNRVEDIFIRRLNGLNDQEVEILQAASIQGYKFDVSLITKLTEISRIKLLKNLQRIEKDLQIIVTTKQGYQFEHPMMRDILYNDIPAMLRKEYHLIVAEEMERIYGPDYGAIIGDVAQHLFRGGSFKKALPLLYDAGKRAFDLSAYSQAILFFEDALVAIKNSSASVETISKSDLYFKLGICYEEGSLWEKSIDTYNKLLETCKETSDAKSQTDALLRLGRVYGKLGDWSNAISFYNECLRVGQAHSVKNILSRAYNNLGVIYFQKGDFEQALNYFEKTIGAVDDPNGKLDEAHALTNIGIIANIRAEYDNAMENYEKALSIYQHDERCKQDEARIYHNMGMTLSDQRKFTEAIAAFESCLELSEKVEDKQLTALTHLNMGKTYVYTNELTKARELTDKALKLFKRTQDTLNVAEAFHVLGLAHELSHEPEIAEKYYKRSIKLNLELDYKEGLAESYFALAGMYRKKQDPGQAADYYNKSLEIFRELNVILKVEEAEKYLRELAPNSGLEVTVVGDSETSGGSHSHGKSKTRERKPA